MKKLCGNLLVVVLIVAFFPQHSLAVGSPAKKISLLAAETYPCAEAGARVTCSEINQLLTESAIEHGIPPEVAKAVAFEESNWQQWDDATQTDPNVSDDGGIGIMQVTDSGYDDNRLKSDIQFNINTGLDILNEKWQLGIDGVIPTFNGNSRDVIENWYFAVMAYNGVVESNSPTLKSDGSTNEEAYQERVFRAIEVYNNRISLVDLPFSREDFQYDRDDGSAALKFNKLHYQVPGPLTESRQLFAEGDKVYTVASTNLRDTKNGQGNTPLPERHVAEILEGTIQYDTSEQSPGRHWVRYEIQLEDGRTGYVASGAIQPITSRVSGTDRFATAVEISKSGWQDGADTVVLAKGYDFPDALAGAPLAYKYDAPILLTRTDHLTEVTKQEINRLGADKVIILGSEAAVSNAVEAELNSMNLQEVERIGGSDRFETAKLIADKLDSNLDKAIVATGLSYPDSLAVAPYAARNGIPILLTKTDSTSDFTKQALEGKSKTYVIGGPNAVSESVAKNLPGDFERISGANRFETASEIIETFDFGDQEAMVATGYNFADALTGSVLAAKKNSPLLLVRENNVTESIEDTIVQRDIRKFTLFGGADVVDVDDELAKIAAGVINP
ncbi:cell wall-binding repeat-containing protein [Virgibacillus flavescens]|uniref:cell wall-binding repeat-containing protein n=1 Tax=Virgibacillus flavescens TaxID=1611422 RepID=UPI003D358366